MGPRIAQPKIMARKASSRQSLDNYPQLAEVFRRRYVVQEPQPCLATGRSPGQKEGEESLELRCGVVPPTARFLPQPAAAEAQPRLPKVSSLKAIFSNATTRFRRRSPPTALRSPASSKKLSIALQTATASISAIYAITRDFPGSRIPFNPQNGATWPTNVLHYLYRIFGGVEQD